MTRQCDRYLEIKDKQHYAGLSSFLPMTRELIAQLEKLIGSDNLNPWLKEPNPVFDGSAPLQVVERGETDRIWRMLYELESGEPG